MKSPQVNEVKNLMNVLNLRYSVEHGNLEYVV